MFKGPNYPPSAPPTLAILTLLLSPAIPHTTTPAPLSLRAYPAMPKQVSPLHRRRRTIWVRSGTPRRCARHTQVIPKALKERQSQSCKKGEKRRMGGRSHLGSRGKTRQLSLKIIIPPLPASPRRQKKGVRWFEVLKARFLLPSISIPTRKAAWITCLFAQESHTLWQRRPNAQF